LEWKFYDVLVPSENSWDDLIPCGNFWDGLCSYKRTNKIG